MRSAPGSAIGPGRSTGWRSGSRRPPHRSSDDGLWSSVRALPAKQRAALVHRFVFDLAYRDVGERMGISEEAARQNVSAGLRRLRLEVDR